MKYAEGNYSTENLKMILDKSPFAIYINSIDNYELLYLNETAKSIPRANASLKHKTCYELMGFDAPCPYCRILKMNSKSLLSREFYDPVDKRTYLMNGMLIDWDGIPAHIEYIIDITARKLVEEAGKTMSEELQSVLRNIPGGLCVYRFAEGKIQPIFHNDAFYTILGYSPQHVFETLEQTNNLGVHPDDIDELNRKIFTAINEEGTTNHIYRVFNDILGEYRWIRLDGTVKRQADGSSLLYGVYSNVNEQVLLEKKLEEESIRMQNIVNAIPGGVAIYKVSDILETVYFSDGVPTLTGYTVEEYRELIKRDALEFVYPPDVPDVVKKVHELIRDNSSIADFEFRKCHRDGSIVWVHIHARIVGEADGCPLVQCVFHNITTLKNARQELDHIVNSIPGGIEVLKYENGNFRVKYYTDGVLALLGSSREEYDEFVKDDALNAVFEKDKPRIKSAIINAVNENKSFDLSYRMIHKNGYPVWVHLNGKLMGMQNNAQEIYTVITGMSEETKLYQSIANETADGIYVIDRQNYDLLYANETVRLFMGQDENAVGKKCYEAIHGKKSPCEFCSLKNHPADNLLHEMIVPDSDRIYHTRFREIDWRGIPAYIKYVSDATEEVRVSKEKERLERYFQTLISNIPGGVAVVRYDEKKNTLIPEFLSEGFATMCGMTLEEAWKVYENDACAGVHPDDAEAAFQKTAEKLKEHNQESFENIYRLRKKDGSYFWVKNTATIISASNEYRIYASYSDVSNEITEQAKLRALYDEMLRRNLMTDDPNIIVMGHSDISENLIIQLIDKTNGQFSGFEGAIRDTFWEKFSLYVPDDEERENLLDIFLSKNMLTAYAEKETKREFNCFIKLPDEISGRYVHAASSMIESPDSGNLICIFTIKDVTEQYLSQKIIQGISNVNFDFIGDVDLEADSYNITYYNDPSYASLGLKGRYSDWVKYALENTIVPKDRDECRKVLNKEYIKLRLAEGSSFSFHYNLFDKNGENVTKKMVVFYIDDKLDRVCFARTDITDSVREQRRLLNILAYTFELVCFIDLHTCELTMHTPETVLKDLPPYRFANYEKAMDRAAETHFPQTSGKEIRRKLTLDEIVKKLVETPNGYDFTFPYVMNGRVCSKQLNVTWGDSVRRTICMVRSDVTDILAAERQSKEHLKNALSIAQEASKAKTDFLSAMSHDIRTPMNAIMGMTELALADRDNPAQIDESLAIIKSSSEHLLHLINDILDMSRIESGKMTLVSDPFNHAVEMEKMIVRASALTGNKNITFRHSINVRHYNCLGDVTKLQQIVDNLIGNAVKFTPEGGEIFLSIEELPEKNENIGWYRFTVSDTGIGIEKENLKHIFEPFYRTSSLGTNHIEGTGLGLSIVKSIVEYKGGTLNVESVPGKGSKFIIDLPICVIESSDEEKHTVSTEVSGELDLSGVNVLLVEDNAVNQLVAQRMLEKINVHVIVAENGAEGVKIFNASGADDIDAICMDIQMPVMNGYEAAQTIRSGKHPRAKSVPIVAMTANAFAGDIKMCLEAGMNAHISKPIEPNKLYQILESFVK